MSNLSIPARIMRLFTGGFREEQGVQSTQPYNSSVTAGVSVTDFSSMQVSAVWACVRLLSEIVGSLPISVYKRGEDGRLPASAHTVQRLLRQPNSHMTLVEFVESMMLHLTLHGNAYAALTRNGVGQVVAMHPLYAANMSVSKMEDGTVVYAYQDQNVTTVYDESSVLHIKGFGPSGLVGLSPLAYARQSVGVSIAAEKFGAHFFSNGARPGGVLMIDRVLKPEQRKALRDNFQEMHSGVGNSHKLNVLEAGMTYQQIGIPPEDAQMLQTRQFQVEDIARFFRVPSFLINDNEKSTSWGTGLEQQNLAFLAYSLRPYLTRWEQAMNKRLIGLRDTDHYVEFNLDGLLRADSSARANFYSTMTQNGLMTRNEARRKENLPSVEGGDELTIQVNLAPLGQEGMQNVEA